MKTSAMSRVARAAAEVVVRDKVVEEDRARAAAVVRDKVVEEDRARVAEELVLARMENVNAHPVELQLHTNRVSPVMKWNVQNAVQL